MPTFLGVVVGVFVGVLVVVIAGRKARAPGIDPTQLTFEPALIAQLRALIAENHQIQAIKLLRESNPGLSLVTAKNIVDRLSVTAAGPPAPAPPEASGQPPEQWADHAPSSSPVPFDVELEVRQLKLQGHLVHAIKLVREHTGMGLKDAKEYVDGLT